MGDFTQAYTPDLNLDCSGKEEKERLIGPGLHDWNQQSREEIFSFSYLRTWRRKRVLRLFLLAILVSLSIIATFIYKVEHRRPYPWRAMCRRSALTHFVLRPTSLDKSVDVLSNPKLWPDDVDESGLYQDYLPTLTPLTSNHPAWPYANKQFPGLIDADNVAPVGVLLGVLTTDDTFVRRELIRSTYGSHPASRKHGTEGVKVVFVIGRPRPEFAALIQAEDELYRDIVILDIEDNMNEGKTHAYFAWAAQHARVPDCQFALGHSWKGQCSGFRTPDYVVKTDDDSFWVLHELERRLRILPREQLYWGRMNTRAWDWLEYMQGGGYALSMDLVKYFATAEFPLSHKRWNEDQRVSDWIRAHPQGDHIIWVTDRCWMYDHPRSNAEDFSNASRNSNGFIFPKLVRAIRSGAETPSLPSGLSRYIASAWSTVSPLYTTYRLSPVDLTTYEQVEALIEGSPLSELHSHNRQYTLISGNEAHDSQPFSSNLRDKAGVAWMKRPTYSDRMEGSDEIGSTVLVHRVKKDEWWKETAWVLLGLGDED